MRFPGILLAVVGLTACATGSTPARERIGEIQFRSYTDPTASPITYTVQTGRVFNANIDLSVAGDGCISGNIARGMVRACNSGKAPPPKDPGDVVQAWTGSSGGNFTVAVSSDGKQLSMLGFVKTSTSLTIPLQAVVPIGAGPAWDEMRNNPALLALAAAAAGARGEPGSQ